MLKYASSLYYNLKTSLFTTTSTACSIPHNPYVTWLILRNSLLNTKRCFPDTTHLHLFNSQPSMPSSSSSAFISIFTYKQNHHYSKPQSPASIPYSLILHPHPTASATVAVCITPIRRYFVQPDFSSTNISLTPS